MPRSTSPNSATGNMHPIRSASNDPLFPNGDFQPVVVAPTYNNAGTLRDMLDRLKVIGLPLIVVNDGSTDTTAAVLSDWSAQLVASNQWHPASNQWHPAPTIPVTILTHAGNRGKAAAMRTGFASARAAGRTHVVTIDTDGQLDPEDIPRMLCVARDAPDAIVLGSRRRDIPGCPKFSRLAWYLTALGIFLETGRRILDSQCGLRVYPLRVLSFVRCRSRRYGFESEILTRALWAGAPIAQVPVACRYFSASQRVSHLKPARDGLRSFFMHFALTVRQVFPWPHRRIPLSRPQSHHPAPRSYRVAGLWASVDPFEVGHRLRSDHFEQLLVAAAMGIGAFVSNMPLGGWRIALAVFVALRTHVHILPTVFASLLCLSPVAPCLEKLAICTGYLIVHGSVPDLATLVPDHLTHWQRLAAVPIAWPVGSLIVGFLCTWTVLPFFERVFRFIPVRTSLLDP